MIKIFTMTALAAAAFVSSAASAQQWGMGYPGYGGYYQRGYGEDLARSVCSGQRAYALESRLDREAREGEIDGYAAARIHQSIDRLEAQQRQECAEGDWRSIARIAGGYDRIGHWIQSEAHGYRRW